MMQRPGQIAVAASAGQDRRNREGRGWDIILGPPFVSSRPIRRFSWEVRASPALRRAHGHSAFNRSISARSAFRASGSFIFGQTS